MCFCSRVGTNRFHISHKLGQGGHVMQAESRAGTCAPSTRTRYLTAPTHTSGARFHVVWITERV